jgi:L-asparaginase
MNKVMTTDQPSILIIYTGGTIGMIKDEQTGALVPFNFDHIYDQMPVLKKIDCQLQFYCFEPIMDSSNMNPDAWIDLVQIIENNYEQYDGFVILHGSDTMAFTASALSFMLENLNKPVIFTGSQLPLGEVRTDGRENFLTSIEIAAAKDDETPIVPEVCIYFENQLLRANRTVKYNSDFFHAFVSGNYPSLAEVGININYKRNNILKPNFKKLKVHKKMDDNVGILKLFPGISVQFIKSILNTPGLKAIVLETFGSGNAPANQEFIGLISKAIQNGLIVVNVTQCMTGIVEQGKYATSSELQKIGVISGKDISTEAAITKLMYLLGRYQELEKVKTLFQIALRGELTE